MPIPILIVTHPNLGKALLETSQQIVNPLPTEVVVLGVPFECDAEQLYQRAEAHCQRLQNENGVLVLTDLHGSTPANIANRLCQENYCYVVSGVNMPMVLRALNYCGENIHSLVNKVVAGGQNGIQAQSPLKPQNK